MDPAAFARWLSQSTSLKPQHLAVFDDAVAALRERAAAVLALEDGDEPLPCPKCGGAQHQRWGTTRTGFQRRRCSGCGATFTARTGTPLAQVQRPGGVARLVALMFGDEASGVGASCRKAARALGVRPMTVWGWRMVLLQALPAALRQARVFTGLVEMDEAYQRESRKAS